MVPNDGDRFISSAISEGSIIVCDKLVSNLVRLSLRQSASAAFSSPVLSERSAVKLIATFPELLSVFLAAGNYSPDKLREAIREEMSEEQIAIVIESVTRYLEDNIPKISENSVEISKYINFIQTIFDSKFINWYVKPSSNVNNLMNKLFSIISKIKVNLINLSKNSKLDLKNHKKFNENYLYYHNVSI